MRGIVLLLIFAALIGVGCSRSRTYELQGQVLAVNAAAREITIKHEDIRGFMPGMTMAFKVEDERLLAGRVPGELVRATLVVRDTDAHLSSIERTGHAPLAEPPPALPSILDPGDPVADAVLVDQTGRTRRLSDWRGQALAVTFIYTRCPLPDFCPAMDREFAAAQRQIAADSSLRGGVHLLSISFDPAHDAPPVLARHAQRVGADPSHWTMLTGEREEVVRFAGQFGVSILPDGPASGGDAAAAPEIVHNLRTAVIGPDGRVVRIFTGNEWKAGELVDQLRTARR